jgi:glutathione S-transferase
MSSLPVLYSFRRCPYAIRARLALAYAGVAVELREVLLRDKPQAMLDASPKGTVPVLVLPEGRVIDESRDVMSWALAQADPDQWRRPPVSGTADDWIAANDGPFKAALDRYKYADRHPEHPPRSHRERGEEHLARLDAILAAHRWLHGGQPGCVDAALFPFIRQFAMVDMAWFRASPYTALCRWLDAWLEHPLFAAVMDRHAPWVPGQAPVRFAPGPGHRESAARGK